MLYLFFGEDTYRSRQKLREFLDCFSHGQNRPFFCPRFSPETFEKGTFEELIKGSSLFGGNYIVVCESFFGEKDIGDFIIERLSFFSRSSNVFLFWEENLDSETIKAFKKHSEKIEEFNFLSFGELKNWLTSEAKKRGVVLSLVSEEDLIGRCGKNLWLLSAELEKHALSSRADLRKRVKTEKVDIFHITDAVSLKDKSRAWFLFQKALLAGSDVEEIFWKIVWQIKNILIIRRLLPLGEKKIAEKSNLHPFVVKKTFAASRNFKEEELSRYSQELIALYHNSRRGLTDFETGIEKFLIKL